MSGNWQVHVAFESWGVLFCLIAAVTIYLSIEGKRGRKRWLFSMFVTQALVLSFDALAWLYRGDVSTAGYYMVRISNAAVFLLNYTMMVLCTGYLCAGTGEPKRLRREFNLSCLIAVCGMLLIIATQFYPLIYQFDSTNHYERGNFFWLSHVVAFAGMVLDGWILVRYRRRFGKAQFFALCAYLGMPFAALVWQMFFYGISMLQIMVTISLMCLFVVIVIGQGNDLIKKEHELSDMKIQIVLSQIQPHFLYNVLNTISYLCDRDASAAKRAINDFSRFLRGNLDSLTSNALVPLDKELEHVEHYLSLEKLRMEDELNIIFDITDNGYMLPSMILQPLVENAILHGLSKEDAGGTLIIRTRRNGNTHEIMVIDDGVGFDVHSYLEGSVKKHVGIDNVRKRLWSLCNGTLTIASEKGKGTRAVICIPVDE